MTYGNKTNQAPSNELTRQESGTGLPIPAMRPWWAGWLLLVIISYTMGSALGILSICFFLACEEYWFLLFISILVGFGLVLAPVLILTIRPVKQIQSIMRSAGNYTSLAELLKENPIRTVGLSTGGIADTILRNLPAEYGKGETLIIQYKPDRLNRYNPDIRLLQQPFEPVDSKDLGARLTSLYEAEQLSTHDTPPPKLTKSSKKTRILVGFWFRRVILYTLWCLWQTFLIYVYIKHGFLTAIRDTWFVQLVTLTPVAYFMTFRANYLFLPSGITRRFAYCWSNHPRLTLFNRQECLTLIIPHGKVELKVHIFHVPTRRRLLFTMDHKACDLFLSAWLSPLPTPTLEEMSDFT